MGRARRIFNGLYAFAAPGGPLSGGVRACLRFVFWLWLIDAGVVLASGKNLGLTRLHGLLAGLGFAALCAIPFGLLIDAIRALTGTAPDSVKPSASPGESWLARGYAWLSEPNVQLQQRRVGAVLGLFPLALLFCAIGFFVSRRVIIGMAQPHFAALTIVALHAVLAIACVALFGAARNLGTLIARALGPTRAFGWLLGSALRLLLVTAGLALALVGAVLVLFWGTFMFLPWSTILALAGASVLAFGAHVLVTRRPRLAAPEAGMLALSCVAAWVAMLMLDARGEISRRAIFDTLDGRVGYAVTLFALDFDQDGHLGMFGGGDCAPFDPNVSPSAVDVPSNGKDEDCDGADLDPKRLAIELRRDWPVPLEFPRRPSIVLITIDTFAATRMKALGYTRRVTPNLDAFAQRSTLFRYTFSQGPSTRLSFPALFTSRWDSQIKKKIEGGGSRPYTIDESEQLLAEVLSNEGYETTAVVPDQYFRKARWPSLTQGFRTVIDSPSRVTAMHNSKDVTDSALGTWQQPRKKPLFLWVHYYDAHSPHQQPRDKDIERFGTARADVYDAELRLVDREVGRLLDGLEKTPGDAPLILITGDHGIAFDPPRHTTFNYGYDLTTAVLHVPLIVHGPMIKTQVRDAIVSTMDVAPTLANLLRVRRKLPFEGASLVPELLEGKATRPERLVHEFFLPERIWENGEPLEAISLRSDRFNLISDRKNGSYELYDWRADYYENHNLADSAEYAQTLLGMKRQLALYTFRLYGSQPQSQGKPAQVSLAPPPH
jgi:arylsulfatase A-like enzyme